MYTMSVTHEEFAALKETVIKTVYVALGLLIAITLMVMGLTAVIMRKDIAWLLFRFVTNVLGVWLCLVALFFIYRLYRRSKLITSNAVSPV